MQKPVGTESVAAVEISVIPLIGGQTHRDRKQTSEPGLGGGRGGLHGDRVSVWEDEEVLDRTVAQQCEHT